MAWGTAIWGKAAPGVPSDNLPTGAKWPRSVPTDWPPPSHGGSARSLTMTSIVLSAIHIDNDGRHWTYPYGQSLLQFGMPLRSLECEYRSPAAPYSPRRPTPELIAWVSPIPEYLRPRNIHRVIPLRPIWPGFALNTLFYAALFWLLLCGPFALRRLIRVKRGRCPACGYPVGTSPVCTECGRDVKPRPAMT